MDAPGSIFDVILYVCFYSAAFALHYWYYWCPVVVVIIILLMGRRK